MWRFCILMIIKLILNHFAKIKIILVSWACQSLVGFGGSATSYSLCVDSVFETWTSKSWNSHWQHCSVVCVVCFCESDSVDFVLLHDFLTCHAHWPDNGFEGSLRNTGLSSPSGCTLSLHISSKSHTFPVNKTFTMDDKMHCLSVPFRKTHRGVFWSDATNRKTIISPNTAEKHIFLICYNTTVEFCFAFLFFLL